jgi:hypothetical protein
MSADRDLLSQIEDERVIVVARIDSEPLAQILTDKLNDDGIPARYSRSSVHSAWIGSVALRSGGYPIHVPSWSAERARQLLVDERAGEYLSDARRRPTGDLNSRGLLLVCLLIAGVIAVVGGIAFAT